MLLVLSTNFYFTSLITLEFCNYNKIIKKHNYVPDLDKLSDDNEEVKTTKP